MLAETGSLALRLSVSMHIALCANFFEVPRHCCGQQGGLLA